MKFDENTLSAMLGHLHYEIDMMRMCSKLLEKRPSHDELLQPEYNQFFNTIAWAILEAYLVHARNLYDFLFAKPQQDDVVAMHYFSDPGEWDKLKPEPSKKLCRVRQSTNKHLAHLTATRANGFDTISLRFFGWSINETTQELRNALEIFVDNIPESENRSMLKQLLQMF